MKLDKRACRHAANAPLNISLNAGVLYTDRVKYLVTRRRQAARRA